MTEEQIQRAVASYLDLVVRPPAAWWHTGNGGARSKAVAGKMKAAGQKPGVPDVLILHDGRLHGIKLKVKGSYPTPEQRAFLATIEAHGGNVAVCRSLDEVEGTLRAWGIVAPTTLRRTTPTATGASYTTNGR